MSKPNKIDINQLLLKAHKRGVKNAIDTAALSGTSLIVCEDGKVKAIKPKFKYVRVPIEHAEKKLLSKSSPRRRKK